MNYGFRLVELIVNKIPLHCYLFQNECSKKQRLFIECLNECEYQSFVEVLHDLVLCLSYTTGAFIGKEVFIFNDIFRYTDQSNYVCWFYHPEDLAASQFGVMPQLNDRITEHNSHQTKYGISTLEKMIEKCLH